jgi:hypothetical protein
MFGFLEGLFGGRGDDGDNKQRSHDVYDSGDAVSNRRFEIKRACAIDDLKSDPKYSKASQLIKELEAFSEKYAQISHSKEVIEDVIRNPNIIATGEIHRYQDLSDSMIAEAQNIDKGSSGTGLLHLFPKSDLPKFTGLVRDECSKILKTNTGASMPQVYLDLIREIEQNLLRYQQDREGYCILQVCFIENYLRILLINAVESIPSLTETQRMHFYLLAHAL